MHRTIKSCREAVVWPSFGMRVAAGTGEQLDRVAEPPNPSPGEGEHTN